jgi:hypothetical protein
VVLIRLRVEGADLTLAKGIIQCGVNRVRSDIHTRRGGPVDDEVFGKPTWLIVGGHVLQLRLLPQLRNHSFGPCIKLGLIRIAKRVLKLIAACSVVDGEVLYRL